MTKLEPKLQQLLNAGIHCPRCKTGFIGLSNGDPRFEPRLRCNLCHIPVCVTYNLMTGELLNVSDAEMTIINKEEYNMSNVKKEAFIVDEPATGITEAMRRDGKTCRQKGVKCISCSLTDTCIDYVVPDGTLSNSNVSKTKVCKDCGAELPIEDFYKGYAVCRQCTRQKRKQDVEAWKLRDALTKLKYGFANLAEVEENKIEDLCVMLANIRGRYHTDVTILHYVLLVVTEEALNEMQYPLVYGDKTYTLNSAKASRRLHESGIKLTYEQQIVVDEILDDALVRFSLKEIIEDMLDMLGKKDKCIQGRQYTALRNMYKVVIWVDID